MRKVRWALQARRDFIRIADYFAALEPGYPERLLIKIDRLARLLAERPGLGVRLPGMAQRKMRVHGTTYILFYHASPTELIIVRVRHAKEDWRPL